MATDMVIGYVYFLESNAADNINWVPTVDNIILSVLYTEGTEYCKLQLPEELRISFNTGIIVDDAGGGEGFDFRTNRRFFEVLAKGIETSRANAATVRNFFMLDRHTVGTAATFKRYYMVVKYGTTTYEPFVDHTSTVRDYCKGVVLNGDSMWRADTPLIAIVRLNWHSTWSD